MNRSFRAPERGQMGSLRLKDNRDEDLALFREMRRREKERNNLLQNSDEFDAPLGLSGSSPLFNLASGAHAPVRKTGAGDFLNSDNDKNDYDWLLTPPGTPLFPSLEMEQQKTLRSQLGSPKARPASLKSRLSNSQPEPTSRSNLPSRPPSSSSSPGLNTSSGGVRRPSSSGGSRPATPTGRPTVTSTSRSTLSSSSNRPTLSAPAKPTSITSSKLTPTATSKPSRSSTPTPRPTLSLSKPTTVPSRSSTLTSRSTIRSSTPTRGTGPTLPASKSTLRSSTPTRRPTSGTSTPALKSPTSSSVSKPVSKNPASARSNSPTVRPKIWKPSEMPGFSLDAPPNLRTSISDRPPSASRGRPGAPSSRSSSIEPIFNGKGRRQSCSPSRGRPPNGVMHSSGSSVPVSAANRLHAKANDNVSPALVGTKMVERVINMRKLVPPKQDDKHSPHSNLSGKSSSSPDSSGFGRTLSKKSLDMAIRHMDIRRTIPGNLRPLMTNIPASSMYSVRSGPTRRTVSVSDSPLATSSNASSEVSVNNNALCMDGHEVDDDVSSGKCIRSPASLRGR
ncbi:hypothetical protein OROGR_022648 [Orobanche gracilis]